METNELKNTWKNIDAEINSKSKDELNLILIGKTRKTLHKFLYVMGISILVCAGLIVFLIITALNRTNDILYLVNNSTLGLITIIALISTLSAWHRMQNHGFDQPLKSWLEEKIKSLTKNLTGKSSKLYLYIIPFLYILTVLSIHVYFENKSLVDVLKSEESIIGLLVGAVFGLFISYYSARKIRKYYKTNLETLEELYHQLCKVN